jgi:hypothetical protein
MRAANRDLTFAGVIVVAPGEADEPITDEQKTALDALHLRKIDLADRVLVVNPRRVHRRVHEQRDRICPRRRQADLVHRSRLTSRRFVGRTGNKSQSASEDERESEPWVMTGPDPDGADGCRGRPRPDRRSSSA